MDEDVAHDGDADSMKYSMFAKIKEVEGSPGIIDYDDGQLVILLWHLSTFKNIS